MWTRVRRLRSAGLAVLLGFGIVVGGVGQGQGQAKEFEIDGTADCGVPSDRRCSIDTILAIWTDDIGGINQRVEVDVSWIRQALGAIDQDDHVCFVVEDRPGGRLQAIGIGQGCEFEGTINPGLSTDDRDVREQPRLKDDDDDKNQNGVAAVPVPTDGPVPGPDLGADLVAQNLAQTIVAGDVLASFIFDAGNGGPQAAGDVVLTLTLPTGTTFAGLLIEDGDEPGGFTCTPPPLGGTGVVTCTDPSVEAFGGGISGQLRVNIPGGAQPGVTYASTASITSSTPDPNPSNNTDTASRTFRAVFVSASAGGNGVDTGLDLTSGQRVTVEATGTGTYGNEGQAGCVGVPRTDPNGNRSIGGVPCSPPTKFAPSMPLPSAPVGALIGRTGTTGSFFLVGSSYASNSLNGRLFLRYNDDNPPDNTDGYTATITIIE